VDASARVTAGDRLRLALAMYEDGVAMMRLSLARRHPHASPGELDDRMRAWLQDRDHADAAGVLRRRPIGRRASPVWTEEARSERSERAPGEEDGVIPPEDRDGASDNRVRPL
jgi:hypothetical protein